MEYVQKLELKPFTERKEGFKYKTIQMTDMAFHTAHKQYMSSPGKKFIQIINSIGPGRIYFPLQNPNTSEKNESVLDRISKDPEFIKYIQEQEKNGYKILISVPKAIPLIPGKDTQEFIKSKNGKRILRRLGKDEAVPKI